MRGKACLFQLADVPAGITPAYAGKSLGSVSIRSHIQDHPRLCGEKTATISRPREDQGSPPPMRGKVRIKAFVLEVNGITPAYAGKSLVVKSNVLVARDHPRLCGEKFV